MSYKFNNGLLGEYLLKNNITREDFLRKNCITEADLARLYSGFEQKLLKLLFTLSEEMGISINLLFVKAVDSNFDFLDDYDINDLDYVILQ